MKGMVGVNQERAAPSLVSSVLTSFMSSLRAAIAPQM